MQYLLYWQSDISGRSVLIVEAEVISTEVTLVLHFKFKFHIFFYFIFHSFSWLNFTWIIFDGFKTFKIIWFIESI